MHHAIVTETRPDYHGSITIDSDLLKASGLLPNEAVLIADCDNGSRLETYIIPGEPGSGVIGLNGAAARLSSPGHRLIIMSFVLCDSHEIHQHHSRVLVLDRDNRIKELIDHKTLPRD